MTSAESDQELVDRAKNGDLKAFDLLVLKYQRRVFRLISRVIKNNSEVEDVAQECFIKAFRAIHQFRGDSAFYTWLYRIAVNTAKNYLFSKGKRPIALSELKKSEDSDSFDMLDAVSNENPEGNMAGLQIAEAVNKAVKKLPDELSAAVVLREMDGLSYEEIAEVMNCPIGTVRSRIFRAREAIAQELRPLLETQGNKRW
ncbi:MAG: RNA polymerase sigma factor RpoE [Proteobacteria bacterium]|nr:RNA polymerase sigma factor RpoE [Pseudomonadota bacterium]